MRNNDRQLLIGQCPESVFAPTFQWSLEVRGIRDASTKNCNSETVLVIGGLVVEHLKITPIQLRLQTQGVRSDQVSLYDIWH